MTQTLDPQTTDSPAAQVQAWLSDFEAALAARDIDRVVAKFATDSFWRDLVAFTWNIKTVEGRDGIASMLTAQLDDTDSVRIPRARRLRPPTAASRRHSSSSRRPSAAASGTCGCAATSAGRS